MSRRLLLASLLSASLGVFAAEPVFETESSSVKFNAGADLRIRQEMMENVPGLPGGGLLSTAPRGSWVNHVRFRPRVWGEVKFGEKLRFYTRLTDEFRWYVHPWNNKYTWPDEVIIDNLLLEGKGLFDGAVDFTVGRQDILNLYGLDHVFIDGTPGDGSRTVYADVVRACFHVDEVSKLDLFGIYDEDENMLRWGTARGNHRSNSGLGGGAEPEMDDWGFGAVWGSRVAGIDYQIFAMQKNTLGFERRGTVHPWTQRELVGAKLLPRLNEEFTLQLEGMGQVGCNGDGATLSAWSSYLGINWLKATESSVKPFAKLGYHFMSGDDDAATEDGGHNAWDPMWARGVNDSEAFLYGTHYGVAWWSNMHYVKFTTGFHFGYHHDVTVSSGPMFAAAQDGLGGGDGLFKGLLSQARYDFPFFVSDKDRGGRFEIFGSILAELFNPGDYFETDKPAYFLRWQVEFRF